MRWRATSTAGSPRAATPTAPRRCATCCAPSWTGCARRKTRTAHCVGSLSYVFNHHERDLAERLTALQHAHHDLTVSTMHAHLDHDHCIESAILRGPVRDVRRFADAISAERGVRHGNLNIVMVDVTPAHRHGRGHAHVHVRPQR